MKRKLICLLLATTLMTTSLANITVYADTTTSNINIGNYVYNTTLTDQVLTVSALDDNTALQSVSTYRGDYQGRAIIPYVLRAGETITLNQGAGTGQVDLTVELKTGLAINDITGVIKKDGTSVSFTAKDESIIYIKIPRQSFSDVSIKYSMTKATTLPTYNQDYSNEANFFAEWDLLNTKNAILKNSVVTLQVPYVNKEYLRNLKSDNVFNNVEHLLEYYEAMIAFYDKLYGLDNSAAYNKKPQQNYLIVPELSENTGVVGAYTQDLVRVYGTSLGLKNMLNGSWESKNIIAQGYRGNFMEYDVSVNNAWDDVLTHYYAMSETTNNSTYKMLYNVSKKALGQETVYNKSYTSVSPEYSPEFLYGIFDLIGTDSLTKFNQEYRRLVTFGQETDTNTNMFAKYFSYFSGIDFSSYFASLGFDVDDKIIENNYLLPNAYYLNDIVKSQEKLDYIMAQYNLASKYALVNTKIFATDKYLQSITGDVEVKVTIDNSAELTGKQVLLKNGDKEYYADIENGQAIFDDIIVGEYKMYMPMTNSGNYYSNSDTFVTVSEKGSTVAYGSYTKMNDNVLNLNYNFGILTDENEQVLSADLSYVSDDNYNLKIQTVAGPYNENATNNNIYAYFKVYDKSNNLVKSYDYTNLAASTSSLLNITLQKGYTIHLYRKDARDKKYYENTLTNTRYYENSLDLMVFEINNNGLTCISGTDKSGEALSKFITLGNGDAFRARTQYYKTNERVALKSGINHITNEQERNYYLSNNVQALRLNNPVLTLNKTSIGAKTGSKLDITGVATAVDAEDGNLTNYITVDTSTVNLNKSGTYTATIRVEDFDHNYDEETISVIVVGQDIDDGSSNNTGDTGNTGNTGNTGDNGSTSVNENASVTIANRTPYATSSYDVSNSFTTTANKNRIVPYYVNDKGEIIRIKYSIYDSEANDVVYINKTGTADINYLADKKSFTDTGSSWAKGNIEYVTAREILNGVSENEFAPNLTVSRAMIVTVLGRLCNVDASVYSNTYVDVAANTWYTDFAAWAKATGILGASDATHFNPNTSINREDFAVAVHNYLEYTGYDITVNNKVLFVDDSSISANAKDAVYTLKAIGIVNGDQSNRYNPKSNLTRAELAAILQRLIEYSVNVEDELN